MSAFDMVLVALIFLVLVGFLVAVILFGAGITTQLGEASTQLQSALQQTFVTFRALVTNVVSSIQDFSDLAIQSLSQFVTKTGNIFATIGVFFRDQVASIIETFTAQVVDTVTFLTRTVAKALTTIAGAVGDVINEVITWTGGVLTSVTGLIARAFALVSEFISSLIILVVRGVTTGISLLIDQLIALIVLISGGITIITQEIIDAISILNTAFTTGFAQLQFWINQINAGITTVLPGKLNEAFQMVFTAVSQIFNGIMCAVLAPLCSELPSVIAPPSLCQAIRDAGGCG